VPRACQTDDPVLPATRKLARLVTGSRHCRSDLPHSMLLPGFSDPLVQNSRYKSGTTKTGAIALSVVPYRALQCDRCLVITT